MLVHGAVPRGHVDGGTERTVRNREGVERVGGVRPKYWVPRRSSRARPSMALCSARVEPGISFERQDHRDIGTRVLMKFLRSAFEGPESHQCRTMGLKRVPQEET